MIERRSTADMIGEFLREAALLLMVFVPLDWFFQAPEHRLTARRIAAMLVVPVALLVVGIIVERFRG